MAKMEIELSDEAQAMWDLMVVGGANPHLSFSVTYKDTFGAYGVDLDEAIENAFLNWKDNGKD